MTKKTKSTTRPATTVSEINLNHVRGGGFGSFIVKHRKEKIGGP